MLDNNAEKIRIVDEEGMEIAEQLLLLLVTDLFLSVNQARKMAVPVLASMGVDEIASEYGVEVIRVRNDHQAMMNAKTSMDVDFVGGTRGGFIFPGFQLGADAMFSTAKILELLARTDQRFSGLRKKFSDLVYLSEDVPCNWRKKGQVMRNLITHTAEEDRQLVDGIRVMRDGGWVLIAPDREKDLFHIYSESRDRNMAHEYIKEFREKIDAMQK
jgi:mannose-1-phosphate guanylyltransferase/phosphomannomutase